MRNGPAVGVLTPFAGGSYYGDILGGIARAAFAAGGTVVAIQTLDAGSHMAELKTSPAAVPPIAHDRVQGFIALVNAVRRDHLRRLRSGGYPIVLVGHQYPGFTCPTVLAENGTGVREAVDHLIEHGHRRIAFTGYTAASDVQERYDAYAETLLAHGIEPDPALFFPAIDSLEAGGVDAALRMMAVGLPATAVVAGTDLNAFGLMNTLIEHGHRVPEDLAVVGFDDIHAAAYSTPTLSSVRQLLDTMGRTAFELAAAQIDGEHRGDEPVRIPTAFVARGSCGCGAQAAGDTGPVSGGPRAVLADRLRPLLPTAKIILPEQEAAVAAGASAVADVIEAAVAAEPTPSWLPTSRALAGLFSVKRQPETLSIVLRAAQGFAAQVAPPESTDPAVVHRVALAVQHVMLLLAHAQGQLDFEDNEAHRTAVSSLYEISMDMLHDTREDPKRLGWLARTAARGGCLGLWAAAEADDRPGVELDVVGGYARRPGGLRPGGPTAVPAFPPAELLELVERPDDVVFVVPAKVNTIDWGLLAVVDEVDSRGRNGRECLNQYAALLTVALDQRRQERRLQHAAFYDTLTGLANRRLFLEHLNHAAARAKRHPGCRFAVLFLDLDDFKAINDSLGHAAGDDVLMWVAARIMDCLRESDTAARFGGDEFLILLNDVDDAAAGTVAERLTVALTEPLRLAGRDVTVGASIGVAMSDDGEPTVEDILRRADEAMYRMKTARKVGGELVR